MAQTTRYLDTACSHLCKCDEKQPTCSRCSRLGLVCVGSGQQRYKFKDGHSVLHNSGKGRQQDLSIRAKVKRKQEEVGVIITFPSNLLSSLSHAFVKAIKPSTGLRYNLVWTYGGFLQDVPRRLGMNEALDAAADALVASHSSFCVHRMISVEALTKYSLALNKIRICLDDPIKARTSETLCAIYLVLLCQVNMLLYRIKPLLTLLGVSWYSRSTLDGAYRGRCTCPQGSGVS